MDGEEYFLPPKTPKSKRQVAIPEFVYQEAMSYINSLYEISPDERIFYFTRSFLYKEIRRISHAAGVDCIRVHDLRHPYVKHTTKKYNSEKQKTQATKMDLIAWVFRFCTFNYSKRSWTL